MKHAIGRPRLSDVPLEDLNLNVINVFEIDSNTVRAGIQLADIGNSVGTYAIFDISMSSESHFEQVFADEDFIVSYHWTREQDLALEIGNVVRRRSTGWQKDKPGTVFLQAGHILDKENDYVFGKGGEMFRRSGADTRPVDVPGSETIFAMDGQDGNLFAVGSRGTVYRVTGDSCELIEVGIGTDFRTLLVDRDSIYLGGDFATFGRFQDEEFRIFENELEGDVLTICKFRDTIYVGDSEFGISVLRDDELVDMAETGYIYRLNPGPEYMTCASGEYIFQFDGKDWRGLELKFDRGLRTEFADMSILD